MEQGKRSDSTVMSARQAEAEHTHDWNREPDLAPAIDRMLTGPAAATAAGDDPIFAAIEENRRLYAAWAATNALPEVPGTHDRPPEAVAAMQAFYGQCDEVLFASAPRTAEGCKALAGYAVEFARRESWTLDQDNGGRDHLRILDLIARSPAASGPARDKAGATVDASPLAQALHARVARLEWLGNRDNTAGMSDADWDAELDAEGADFRRAIREPSSGPADLAAKARLMLSDLNENKPVEMYDSDDYRLMRVILREVIAAGETVPDEPFTVEGAAVLPFEAYTFDTPVLSPQQWADRFAKQALGMHVADRALRMTKPELMAFVSEGGERDPSLPETIFRAINIAQDTFDGWGKLLGVARARFMVAASAEIVASGTSQAGA